MCSWDTNKRMPILAKVEEQKSYCNSTEKLWQQDASNWEKKFYLEMWIFSEAIFIA